MSDEIMKWLDRRAVEKHALPLVEYIQPVCRSCGRGLYVTPAQGDADDECLCTSHGKIEKELVLFVPCERYGDVVIAPMLYETLQ